MNEVTQHIIQTYLRTTDPAERRYACNQARYQLRKRGYAWDEVELILQQAVEEAHLAIYYAPLNEAERSDK